MVRVRCDINDNKKNLYTDILCFDILPTVDDDDEYAFKSPAVVETSSKPTHNNFSLYHGTRGERARRRRREIKKVYIVCCC